MKINLIPGFGWRFAVRSLDFFSVFLIIVFSTYLIFDNTSKELKIISDLAYYLWIVAAIILFLVWFIIIPFLTNGYTIFRFIFRIKLTSHNKKRISLISILKNEIIYSISWVIIIIFSAVFIDKDLVVKLSQNTPQNDKLTSAEKFKIAFPSAVSGISTLLNFLVLFSSVINKNNLTITEIFFKTNLIFINKFNQDQNKNNNDVTLEPKDYKEPTIKLL